MRLIRPINLQTDPSGCGEESCEVIDWCPILLTSINISVISLSHRFFPLPCNAKGHERALIMTTGSTNMDSVRSIQTTYTIVRSIDRLARNVRIHTRLNSLNLTVMALLTDSFVYFQASTTNTGATSLWRCKYLCLYIKRKFEIFQLWSRYLLFVWRTYWLLSSRMCQSESSFVLVFSNIR